MCPRMCGDGRRERCDWEALLASSSSELLWSQEEPQNMGPWSYVAPRFQQQLACQVSSPLLVSDRHPPPLAQLCPLCSSAWSAGRRCPPPPWGSGASTSSSRRPSSPPPSPEASQVPADSWVGPSVPMPTCRVAEPCDLGPKGCLSVFRGSGSRNRLDAFTWALTGLIQLHPPSSLEFQPFRQLTITNWSLRLTPPTRTALAQHQP